MPYKCAEPVIHDGRAFAVGEQVPDDMITKEQAKILIDHGVLEKSKQAITKKEQKTIGAKKVRLTKVLDLQVLTEEKALDKVNTEQTLGTLYRWQTQESKGMKRKLVINALARQIAAIER